MKLKSAPYSAIYENGMYLINPFLELKQWPRYLIYIVILIGRSDNPV
jgi:hypothetical protein